MPFAQLRGLTIGLRSARLEHDAELDQLSGVMLDELDRLERPDPDALVRRVVEALDELDADGLAERERGAASGRFPRLQARLDGTGGRLVGELDAAGLALLDAATAPSAGQISAAGGRGPARLDLLLARLASSQPGPTPGSRPNLAATARVGDGRPGCSARHLHGAGL